MRHAFIVVIAALALAACGRSEMATGKTAPSVQYAAEDARVATEAMAPANAPVSADAPAATDAAGGETRSVAPTSDNPSAGVALLAYVYGATLELPARGVRAEMAKHEAGCRAAGAAICQVLGSSVNAADDENAVSGQMQIRAQPRWLEAFRNRLDGEARAAGGRVRETSVESEDLTRQIVDTDARLRAQKTLRDRLQALLKSRPGRLSDLLETERELARVQGEIDSAESELAVMRQRVATSLLNLSYQSKPNAVTGGTFEPVVGAITEFASIVMQGIAFIIRLVAFLIPVGLVVVPLGWWFLRWRRARAMKKAAARAATSQGVS